MKYLFTLIILASGLTTFAQRGKDGAITITASNTIVNAYTPVTANANAGSTTINVGSSAGFNVGDLVLIIQMQGAKINAQWDTVWVDPNNSMSVPNSNNIDFGNILSYQTSGNNEFAQINAVPNGTSLVLDCGLKNNYTYSFTTNLGGPHTVYGKIQVVKVPRYSSLTVNAPGFITCQQWNGTTGGIAVVEVETNTALNATPSFNVNGRGFRGGATDNAASVFGGNKWGGLLLNQGAYKGESIGGDTTQYKEYAASIGRGAIANGGGGGCAHNAGGGGGGNGGAVASYNGFGNPAAGFNTAWNRESANFALTTSSGGGRGGYSFADNNLNPTTAAGAPGQAGWGGDGRRNMGGFGGRPLDYSTGRIFLGGGGGAGDGNDNQAGAGGNGGGMVYIVTYGNLTGAGTIVADGANGSNSGTGCTSNDGGGGGGAGGTIVLNVNGTINLTAGTALSARGGNGGNQNFGSPCTSNDSYGPGAGGGGGYISCSAAVPTNNLAGGTNGIISGNLSNMVTAFPPNGATAGGAGSSGSIVNYTLTASPNQTLCANQNFTITATSTQPGATISWYNAAAGGSAIATGTAYASSFPSSGTYTLYAGFCPGTYRQPVTITVNSGLAITVNSATICPGQAVTLTANGATSYTWTSPSANTNTISVSPASTTVYTVNGASGLCSGSQTATVTVAGIPTINVAGASICSGSSATLTASGATNYTWNPGGQTTTTVAVTPTITTTYTITGSNGVCSNTTTASVNVTTTPTLALSSVTICPAQTATLNVSGATSYTWNPGNTNGATYTIAPSSSTTVSVIGANGTCTSQATASVTIGSGISISVTSATICNGQSTILTANGATSYTWTSPAANTNTISVSPTSTTVYSVNGTSGACSGSNTGTVTVVSVPSVTVANESICSGNTATLTANGATNYTWNPGGQITNTIAVTPTITTTYTITGSNGVCSNTTTASVNVTATPTLALSSVTICPAQTASLNVSGATVYTWTPGNTTGTTYTIAPSSSTTVSVIGANGTCTSQATASVTIGSGISITVNSPTICAGQTATLTANGATSYTWNTTPAAITNSILVLPASTTIFTVNGASGACTGSNTATVTVNNLPVVTVNSASICSGQQATLTANGANTYTWSNTVNGNSQTVSPVTTTIYTVSGTDNNGCVSAAAASSTVDVTTTPTVAVNSVTICAGQTTTLNASGANSYTWNPGNTNGTSLVVTPATNSSYTITGANGACTSQTVAGVTISSNLSIAVNSATICNGQSATLTASGVTTFTWVSPASNASSVNVSPTSTTVYTVSGSNGSCSGSGTGTVTVLSNPVITASASSTCSGGLSTLSASGATSYTWSNGIQGSTQNVIVPNTTTYTVTGTNGGGCAGTATVTVITDGPSAQFASAQGNVVSAGTTVHFTNQSTNAVSYFWSLCDGSTFTSTDVFASFTGTGTCCVYLVAESANGCKDTVMNCIEFVDEATINIPNVFTPNGDTKNDVFKITSTGVKSLECAIYDRWGLKLYEWSGINGGWDGSVKSGMAPDGTYFFILHYTDQKDKTTTEKGFLSLFRD